MAKRDEEGEDVSGHWALIHPSEYVKAADLKGRDCTVIIVKLRKLAVTMEGGRKDKCVVAYLRNAFTGKDIAKKMILNKTNMKLIAAVVGNPDVSTWVGQKVTLWGTTCETGKDRKVVECIRVRARTAQTQSDLPVEMMAEPSQRGTADDEPGKDG